MEKPRIFTTTFASVYHLYVKKVENKGRAKEEVTDPLMQKIRFLDKLVDELAKGKAMDKILRSNG